MTSTRIKAATMACLVMLLATVFATPASADNDYNWAGRTLLSSSAGSETPQTTRCQMAAYGKVDGRKVLFTANHCFNNDGTQTKPVGGNILDNTGNVYGTVPSQSECSPTYDLCFIWLNSANWPSNPHQIWGGTDGWTTIVGRRGSVAWSCNNYMSKIGDSVYEYQQNDWNDSSRPRAGAHHGTAGNCSIWTYIPGNDLYRHSGSALLDASDRIAGIGHLRNSDNEMIYSNFFEGIQQIHNYFLDRYSHLGAWVCTTAACT